MEAIAAQSPDPTSPSHQTINQMQQTDQLERLDKLVDDRVERISNIVSNQVAGQMEKSGEKWFVLVAPSSVKLSAKWDDPVSRRPV